MKSMILEKKHKWIIYLAIFLFFLIWQWNGMLTFSLDGWSDPGIHNLETIASFNDSVDFGKDVNENYSCLGWLYLGNWVAVASEHGYVSIILKMIVINFLSAFLRTLIIALLWERTTTKFSKIIAFLDTLLVLLMFQIQYALMPDLLVLTASFLLYRIHTMLKENTSNLQKKFNIRIYILVVSVAVLMAIVPLAKFSYIAMTLSLFIILIAMLVFRRRFVEIGVLIGTYLITTIAIWALSGEKIKLIISYFKSMLRFSLGGYSENFSNSFNDVGYTFPQFILFLGFCIAYVIVLLYLLKKDKFNCVGWFIIAPFVFLWFKELFVRSDVSHIVYLEYSLLYILCYLLFMIKEIETSHKESTLAIEKAAKDSNRINFLCVNRYFWSTLLVLLLIPNVVAKGWYPTSTAYSDYEIMKDRETFSKEIKDFKENAQKDSVYATLYEDIKSYPDATLGMLSGAQNFFIAYDLLERYRMHPSVTLWQNTSSYTELAINEQYSGEEAPEILLYHPEPLDGVSNINRMGTILEAMLQNYHLEKLDANGYLVLKHDEEDYKTEPYSLGEPQKIKVGESIEVPKVDNSYVFMTVNWDLTPLGNIAKFILKPTQTRIEMITDNGAVYEYRFLRTLAENGIYVSNWAESSTALADVFRGDTLNNSIKSIRFIGDSVCYNKDIEVSFYAVPFSEKQTSYQTVKFEFASDIPSGDYQVFYAQGYNFAEENSKWISVGSGQKSLVAALPSEGWNSFRLDFPPKSGITCDLSSVAIKNQEDVRVNLVTASDIVCEETDGVFRITTTGNDPYIIFSAVNMAEEQNVIIPTSRTEEGACSVDSISNVSGDGFSINGWALDISGIDVPSSVYVSLNKKYYKMEQMVRNDVSETFVNDNLTNSGFGGYISTENLPAGTYPVELIVISADGKSYYSHYVCNTTV